MILVKKPKHDPTTCDECEKKSEANKRKWDSILKGTWI